MTWPRTSIGQDSMLGSHLRPLVCVTACVLLIACAAKAPSRPAGAAVPDPAALQLFDEATRACRGLRTITTEIALSGRAGGERVRGRLIAGFALPQSARLEAVAPFGPPVFILTARENVATLLFPREKRVLSETPIATVLERLTGLDLAADDLRLVLSGCLVAEPAAADGRSWPNGWKAVTLGAGRVAYLRQVRGAWVLAAADYGTWRLDYSDHLNSWPRTVRVRAAEGAEVDLTARLDQLEVNVEIASGAFSVDVPSDFERIGLDDLRSVAPLREKP